MFTADDNRVHTSHNMQTSLPIKEDRKEQLDNDALIKRLKRLIDLGFYSLIPLTFVFIVSGILANSLTVMSMALDCGLAFIVQFFAFQSIRTIQKSDIIRFPYGTGKLENFSGFLYGALAIPTGVYIFYFSVFRLLSPVQAISFTIAQIPLLPSLARSLCLFRYARLLRKQADSPMIDAYHFAFKISAVMDAAVLSVIIVAWLLARCGHGTLAYYLDPAVSTLLALYMLYTGVTLMIANFKIMMDLPLPEKEQLKIMNVLCREYDSYENVGNIYTRRSGRQRFIEIELYLNENTGLKDIVALKARLQKGLEESFEDVKFGLIPLSQVSAAARRKP